METSLSVRVVVAWYWNLGAWLKLIYLFYVFLLPSTHIFANWQLLHIYYSANILRLLLLGGVDVLSTDFRDCQWWSQSISLSHRGSCIYFHIIFGNYTIRRGKERSVSVCVCVKRRRIIQIPLAKWTNRLQRLSNFCVTSMFQERHDQ